MRRTLARRLRIGLVLVVAASSFSALGVTMFAHAAAAANHEQTDGWVYRSSDSDCAYYNDAWLGPWYVETDAYLAYTYFGLYTITCATNWNRPPGNIGDGAWWYDNSVQNPSSATECAYSNYYYNTQTASGWAVWWAQGTISQYCSNYTWLLSGNWEWNGAWHGGFVYPGAWNY